MKILFLASSGGDAHRRALYALVADARLHHDVRVLAPDAEGKLLRPLGVPVESWKPAGLFNVLRSTGALRRAVEHHVPDVVHAVGWTAAAVALGALSPANAAKTIVTVLDPIRPGEIPKPFVDKRLPELLQRAGCVTCAYATLAGELASRFGVAAERVEVVPYAVVPVHPGGITRPAGRAGPIVGYLSRHDVDRGWETAVEVIALLRETLPRARLRLSASGRVRDLVRVSARARALPPDVICTDEHAPAAFFREIDLLIVPGGREGLPYAVLQALVDGLPLVAGDHAGLADTLGTFATGWLVRGDAAGLVAGILAAWPRIDDAWAGAQAQRSAAAAAFAPAAVTERTRALYARVGTLASGEEPGQSQASNAEPR